MKLNIKTVGVAVALALTATAANANGLLNTTNSTGSDLVINEWDAGISTGVTIDLAIQAGALPTSTQSWTITNTEFFTVFDAGDDGAFWNIVGATGSTYLTTSTGTTATPVSSEPLGTTSVTHAISSLSTAYGYLGTLGNFSTSTQGAATTTSSNTYWAASLSQGGGNLSDTTDSFSDPGAPGTSTSMILESLGTNGVAKVLGTFTLNFAAAYGSDPTSATLTFTPTQQPPTVPLPAAAWLLGSGLLGLVGIGRRRLAGGAVAA